METLSMNFLVHLIKTNPPIRQRNMLRSKFSDVGVVGLSLSHKKNNSKVKGSRITTWSKRFPFRDYDTFAKPVRLLSVTNPRFYREKKPEKPISFPIPNESCFYILQLNTSNEFGSGIMDANSAILVCLINSTGVAILQRISAALPENDELGNESASCESHHFQRGSVDVITFVGPDMGKIEALWIGLESDSWRLGCLKLTVLKNQSTPDEDLTNAQYNGLQYDFEENDIYLGESSETSIVELQPEHVKELLITNATCLSNIIHSQSSFSLQGLSNSQGMKEYADLKLSLLVYDFLLVSSVATILSLYSSEESVIAFLIGGTSGLLYLLFLQKSVDSLSSNSLSTVGNKENILQSLGGFKGPLSGWAFLLAAFSIVFKYGISDFLVDLTPQELLFATLGFFTCKIAVLFAAFKPLEIDVD